MDGPGNDPNSGRVRRPSSIAELAERATINLYDDSKDLKYYLLLAEKYRKTGKECARRGDLEGAFVELTRAATLLLEKLPLHRDYQAMLNVSRRRSLALNGRDILDKLSKIGPLLVDRYNEWLKKLPEAPNHERMPTALTSKTAQEAEDSKVAESLPDDNLTRFGLGNSTRLYSTRRLGISKADNIAPTTPSQGALYSRPMTITSPIQDAGTIRYPALMLHLPCCLDDAL